VRRLDHVVLAAARRLATALHSPRRRSSSSRRGGDRQAGDEERPVRRGHLISRRRDRRGPLFPRRPRAAELPGLRHARDEDIAYYPRSRKVSLRVSASSPAGAGRLLGRRD